MNRKAIAAKIGIDQAIKLLIEARPRLAPPTSMNSGRIPPSSGMKRKSCKAREDGDLRSRFVRLMLAR